MMYDLLANLTDSLFNNQPADLCSGMTHSVTIPINKIIACRVLIIYAPYCPEPSVPFTNNLAKLSRVVSGQNNSRTFNGLEKTLEWTAQLSFNNSINLQVHTEPPYNNHDPHPTKNDEDGIYTRASCGNR